MQPDRVASADTGIQHPTVSPHGNEQELVIVDDAVIIFHARQK